VSLADRWIPRIIVALLAGAAPALVILASTPADQDVWGRALALGIAVGAAAVLLLVLAERLGARAGNRGRLATWMSARPCTTVVASAVIGALLAMHPLLLGRSLTTPNTGAPMVLYDAPPYVPGSTDTVLEDGRGTDVGAMMWAILPYTVVQREALAHGEWPLWNRFNLAGVPLWGQGQTFALDPFHVASLLVPDAALAMDLRFVVARIVFAAGIGLLVHALTGSLGSAVLMALVTPFIGVYTNRLNHPAYFSLTYAPWVLLGYAALTRAGTTAASARAAAGIAIASWFQLVGSTPKEGVVALAAMHAAGAAGVFLARRRWTERLAALDILAITAVAIVLTTAPHWLIFVDGLTRAFTNYDRPGAVFVGWPEVQAFLLGAASPGWPHPAVHALVAALAAAGLVMGRAAWRNPLIAGCLIALAMVWAIAFGVVPASTLIKVPLLGNVHHIGFASAAATIPLVLVVAGAGAASLMDPSTPRWLSGAGIVAVILLTILLARDLPGETFGPRRLMALYSLAGAVAVVIVVPLARHGASFGWVTALVVGTGAAVITGGLTLVTGVPALDAVLMQPRPRANLQIIPPALEPVVAALEKGDPFRVAPFGLMMIPGTQAFWGLEGIGGPDAVRLPHVEDLSDLLGIGRTPFVWLTMLDKTNLSDARGFLDLLNVRYLVSRPDNLPPGTRAIPAPSQDRISVVERTTAWPRAFFADGVERHDSIFTFVDRLRDADSPFASVDRTEPVALAAVSSLPERATVVSPARDYRLTVNRTSFCVDAPGPGVAALSEAFVDRDFVATLNGVPVPYFRVNHLFKGVVIPAAGEWTVEFEYRPAMWRVSWMMAGAGWLAIAGLAAAGRRRRVQ
jgi:hypothetical protein